MKTLTIAFAMALILSACGEENSGSSGKSLFSSWSNVDTGFVLDLSTADFGTTEMGWVLVTGEVCSSIVLIGGTESQGSGAVAATTYVPGTGGGSDPGCALLDGSFTFTKSDDELQVCVDGQCGTYR